jgi:hypothetical protein
MVVVAHGHRRKQFLNVRSEVGITWRRILHLIQFGSRTADRVPPKRR